MVNKSGDDKVLKELIGSVNKLKQDLRRLLCLRDDVMLLAHRMDKVEEDLMKRDDELVGGKNYEFDRY